MTGFRIWDFRRGDDDDNRASPHGRGLRRVLLSTALEFNYVKAVIGFLLLVLGPALLLGILPSLAVTYGRLILDATVSTRYTPTLAIVALVALVAPLIWIGRPLLPKLVENFWHLHYTLVFPAFVAVREILRSIAERFSAQTATPEQLDRTRRLGTVVGALLFAGGGIALAITLDLSVGLPLVDVERVRPWALVKAALGNAGVILGLSTAAESLYWLWHEIGFSSRVFDWAPNLPETAKPIDRVAHLSDLHFVGERYGCRMETGTYGPKGNRCIHRALRQLAEMHASNPLSRVLVTGDVTDAGTRAEWAEFIDLFQDYPELRARLSFVPGNHDVNIVDRNNPGRYDLPGSASQALRKLRVVLALDALQGTRAHLVNRASGALGPSLNDYLREGERDERLRALAKYGTVSGRREISNVWDAIFPLVEPPSAADRFGLILLNSNARSHFSLTNAIGVVNPSQLKALKSILWRFPHSAWMILLHHQVVEYPVSSISLTDRIGLALVNAPDVLAAIAPHASRCLVLHGHRHRDWIGSCQDVVLCSAPSLTMGSQGDEKCRGSFRIHQFAIRSDGGIRLTATDRVKVSQRDCC